MVGARFSSCRLVRAEGGRWTETVLYSFGNGNDGADPRAGLTMDAAGNLYGTTLDGGIYGKGTVFELSPGAGGGWAETILYSFGNGTDAAIPVGGLIMDGAGDIYGTSEADGAGGCGTVYELSHGAGAWTETVLHSFDGIHGCAPQAALVMDAAGNLYGTTIDGGGLGTTAYFSVVEQCSSWHLALAAVGRRGLFINSMDSRTEDNLHPA